MLEQWIGGAGYLVLILATQLRRRRLFLVIDFCGLTPVVLHYVLLDALAGAAMSALYMLVDLTVALARRPRTIRSAYGACYAVAGVTIFMAYEAPTDLLAAAGTIAAVVARQQPAMRRLLAWIVVSCVGWGLYGYFAGSLAQIAFSSVYAVASTLGIVRLDRQPWSWSPQDDGPVVGRD